MQRYSAYGVVKKRERQRWLLYDDGERKQKLEACLARALRNRSHHAADRFDYGNSWLASILEEITNFRAGRTNVPSKCHIFYKESEDAYNIKLKTTSRVYQSEPSRARQPRPDPAVSFQPYLALHVQCHRTMSNSYSLNPAATRKTTTLGEKISSTLSPLFGTASLLHRSCVSDHFSVPVTKAHRCK